MKKFMFTAVAMMAFVGSSMANSVIEEEITVTNQAKISRQKDGNVQLLTYNCDLVKFRIYNMAIDKGYSPEEATSYSYTAYFNCKIKNLQQEEEGLSQN